MALMNQNLSQYIPLAIVALGAWLLVKKLGAQVLHVVLALVLGILLAGSLVGPDISNFLSSLTRGYLQ